MKLRLCGENAGYLGRDWAARGMVASFEGLTLPPGRAVAEGIVHLHGRLIGPGADAMYDSHIKQLANEAGGVGVRIETEAGVRL